MGHVPGVQRAFKMLDPTRHPASDLHSDATPTTGSNETALTKRAKPAERQGGRPCKASLQPMEGDELNLCRVRLSDGGRDVPSRTFK